MDDQIYRLQQQAAERVQRMRAYERSIVGLEPVAVPEAEEEVAEALPPPLPPPLPPRPVHKRGLLGGKLDSEQLLLLALAMVLLQEGTEGRWTALALVYVALAE